MTTPLPYVEITDPTYSSLAATTFTVVAASGDIVVLRGTCPRCGAVLEVPVVPSIFDGMRGGTDLAAAAGGTVEPVVCTCTHQHPDRPEGTTGCGAYWTLVLTRTGS